MFSRVCAKPFRIFLGEFCSASGVCIAATALLLLCASDARWSQKGSSLESLGRGRRGSGVKGECWLAKVVSAVERDLQALSARDSQHNAIPCRCSTSSYILTCNSFCDAWRETCSIPSRAFPGWGVATASVTACSVFPSISVHYALEKVSEICFYFQPCRNPSWVEAVPKLLELGNIQRNAKMIKNNLCTWKFLIVP